MSQWIFDFALSWLKAIIVINITNVYLFFEYLIFPMLIWEAVLALLLPPLTNSLATMHIIRAVTIVTCVPACILSLPSPHSAYCLIKGFFLLLFNFLHVRSDQQHL